MLILQHLAGAVALAVDQHRIADAGLGVIQRDEIPALVLRVEGERLHDQQAAVLESRVADGGYHCTDNFSDDHVK